MDDHESGQLDAERLDKGMQLAFGLASQREGESVLDAIERVTGTHARVSLTDPGDDGGPIMRIPGAAEASGVLEDTRYQVIGEIARGGVGVVYRGRDRDLGREVAIKVLRSDRSGSPEVVQRFIEEAQIEGQLQHPGVVPVYGLGVQPDGRPYFAMKLVKGETLAALLKARSEVGAGRRRLITAFEQVCQTIAYAHARRVVHRDLKPANVLVGGFGEVQVVDWGFAKVLSRGGDADEARAARHEEPATSLIQTVRTGDESSQSVAGSVLGTPAYMPPEQAGGYVRKVDETSDVFSLGAILTEILTGHPPYEGETMRDILRCAREADTDEALARLDACGADPAIVDLAKRCLAPAQAARPHDARQVAEAVHAYLVSVEDRAHRADIRAAEARVKADGERRARRLTVGLAAAVLVAVVGAGATQWHFAQKRQARESRATQTVSEALERASLALGRARQADAMDLAPWDAVVREAGGAVDLAAKVEAPAEVRTRAAGLQALASTEATAARARAAHLAEEDALFARMRETREIPWVMKLKGVNAVDNEGVDAQFAEAFRASGIDEAEPDAAAARVRESRHAEAILASLDTWRRYRLGVESDTKALETLLAKADPDPLRTRLRVAEREKDLADLVAALPEPQWEEAPALTLRLLCWALARAGDPAGALRVARVWQAQAPYDHDANFVLGMSLLSQTPTASPHLQEAITAFTRAAAAHRDGLADRILLARAQGAMRLLDAAMGTLREGLALAPADPYLTLQLADYLLARGELYRRSNVLVPGQVVGLVPAREAFREAVGLLEALDAEALTPRIAYLHGLLTLVARDMQDWPEELRSARRTLELDPKALPPVHEALAQGLAHAGEWEEALAILAEVEAKGHVCEGLFWRRGEVLQALGRLEEALDCFERARGMLRAGPSSGTWRATGLAWEAGALALLGRNEEAVARCREAVEADPAEPFGHLELARRLRAQGDDEGARQAWAAAAEAKCARVKAQLGMAGSRVPAFIGWGQVIVRTLTPDAARAQFHDRFPDALPVHEAAFLTGMASALQNVLLEPEQAGVCLEAALALDPRCHFAWELRGWRRSYAGDLEGAIEAMRKAGECQGSAHTMARQLTQLYVDAGRIEDVLALSDGCEHCQVAEPFWRRFMALEERVAAFEEGTWRPEPGEEAQTFGTVLSTRNRHDLLIDWTKEILAQTPPAEDPERKRVFWRPLAYHRGFHAAACLAGDERRSVEMRNEDRRLAAAWLQAYVDALPTLERFANPYAPDTRATEFAASWYRSELAPIRDEEAMQEAPDDVRAACRAAWASWRAYFESVR